MTDLVTWLASGSAATLGLGLTGQAANVIYRDWRADRNALTKARDAELEALRTRIRELESAATKDTTAHRDTTERLLREALQREHDVVEALLAVRELPDVVREGLENLGRTHDTVGRAVEAVLTHLRLGSRDDDERPSSSDRRGRR